MNARIISLVIAFLLLATVPLWTPGIYYVNVASQVLIYAVFALGLNILAGYGGLVSLGHAGLFGIASYAAAYALQHGFDHAPSILLAIVAGILSTALSALLSLRSSGSGFIMITLAIGQL